jgi:hypothetical protein
LRILRGGTVNDNAHNDVIQNWATADGRFPRDWTVRHNWIELDTATPGYRSWFMFHGMTGTYKIYGNVFMGRRGGSGSNGALMRGTSGLTAHFYNNTVIRSKGPNNLIRIWTDSTTDSSTTSFDLKNNVIYVAEGNQDHIIGTTNGTTEFLGSFTHESNIYKDAGSGKYLLMSCENYKSPSELCQSDPKFVNFSAANFSLAAGSPAKGSGANLSSEYSQLIKPGATWPNPALTTTIGNMGAYGNP